MKKLGFVGWRGMVGSVLMERMQQEKDLLHFETSFFSTSQKGQLGPEVLHQQRRPLLDAFDFESLAQQDILLSCQGSEYTQKIHGELRKKGWQGYWIDAASALRQEDSSLLVLDPFNASSIREARKQGKKDFIGANCTVSLMLMAIGVLLQEDLVEAIDASTYQAISGAGTEALLRLCRETREQFSQLATADDSERLVQDLLQMPASGAGDFALNVLPWIDSEVEQGQTREEWTAEAVTH